VSAETRDAHPEVPWADIVGMRSKIVHDYMNVDEDIVWEVASRDLPTLVAALERLHLTTDVLTRSRRAVSSGCLPGDNPCVSYRSALCPSLAL